MNNSDDHRRAAFSDAAANPFDWKPVEPDLLAADLAASHPHYRITEYISHGGMGAVYRATDNRPGALFPNIALKFIRHDLKEDEEYLECFDREINSLQRITDESAADTVPHHQGIIRILDHGRTEDGVPFLVMPFLEGETLASLLEKPRLEELNALQLMGKICSAVAHAHTNQVVHRDLKPANIYLYTDSDGELQPVILDFGIARTRQSATDRPTIPGQFHGTNGYTAPEVIRGEAASYPADVFALGKICLQLLSGNDERIAIPEKLQSIILRATSDPIGLRYQTAGEFAKALKNVPPDKASNPAQSPDQPSIESNDLPSDLKIKFDNNGLKVGEKIIPKHPILRDLFEPLGTFSQKKSTTFSVFETNSGPPYKTMFYWDELGLIAYCYGDNEDSKIENLYLYLSPDEPCGPIKSFSGRVSLHEELITNCSTLESLVNSERINLFTRIKPGSIPIDCGFSENGCQLRLGLSEEQKTVSTIGFHFPPSKNMSDRKMERWSTLYEAEEGQAHAEVSRMLGPLLGELSPSFHKKVAFENKLLTWGVFTLVPIGAIFSSISFGVVNWGEGMVTLADNVLLGWLKYLGSIVLGLLFGALVAFAGVWMLTSAFWGIHRENINGTKLKSKKLELKRRLKRFSDNLPPHQAVTSILKMASSRAKTESYRWPFNEEYRRRKCWGESGLLDYCNKLYKEEILSEKK